MGDFIFGFLIGKTIIWSLRLVRFAFRVTWWLAFFLLLSLGAGAAWLVRGGRPQATDTGGFGHYLENETLWQDDASGTVYPVSGEREYCEIHAELTGQHWRRTAIARLLRRGAVWKYKFSASGVSATHGPESVAAWCEFQQEARKNITLDHLDPQLAGLPELAGIPADVMEANREAAFAAHKHVEWLLAERGWEPAGRSTEPSNAHWYATGYSRRAISWNAPIDRAGSAALATGHSADRSAAGSPPPDGQLSGGQS